ncbi:MAG: hypothetical protein K2Y37_26440, partial [Pirellulales bacterium]|nr:hypothetical protein [Pirellulales bacterium]
DCFDGTATHVLRMLEESTPAWERRDSLWPRSARALSGQLRKLSPALRTLGVSVTYSRHWDHGRSRTITLTRVPDSRPTSSRSASP